jgi:hypothetical protein
MEFKPEYSTIPYLLGPQMPPIELIPITPLLVANMLIFDKKTQITIL